ncbi:MAG: peptidyl-dipeptidase, partial [Ponticaulis sp.]|nr:peptidyl-dipeptidase [Ponticaulis sp.]
MWKSLLIASAASMALLTGCSQPETESSTQAAEQEVPVTPAVSDNPLLADWDTPYGIPPFSEISTEDYMPAIDAGIAEMRNDISAIVENDEPPSFENTIVALDQSGQLLSKVSAVFNNITNTDTTDELRALESEVGRKLTEESDAIYLNQDLFGRVKTVYENLPTMGLGREDERLVELTYRDFTRRGADLSEADKTRLREINSRLSELSTQFGQNLVRETNGFELHITDEADLAGLSQSLINAGASAAEAKDKDGWLYNLNRSTYEAFMTQSENRELRETMFNGYRNRASNGDDNDSDAIILETVRLRAERAQLLGYESHAAFQLETR